MECNTCHGEIPEGLTICPHCGGRAAVERGRLAELKKIFSNRYDFIRLLGIGGFAEVYLALDKMLEREVAIKILLPQHSQDPQTVERFLREARLYAKLEHKNIIPVYDTGILEGQVFITMKYIRGESLKHVLLAQKRIAASQLPGIISGVAQAMAYIHRKGIIHRDIKPANIIVEKATRNVYLADFGIARAESSQTLTQTGMIVGTPYYLSPEQIKGRKTDQRSDIYSLGATLYELAAGEPPFMGDSPLQILYQHINENARSLTKLVPNIDPVVQRIIVRCLEKDPERRFQNAAEILAILEDGAGAFPNAHFEKTVLTADIRPRRRPAWKVAAALVFCAAVACGVYFIWLNKTGPSPVPVKKETMTVVAPKTIVKEEPLPEPAGKQGERVAMPTDNAPASKMEISLRKPAGKAPEKAAAPGTVHFSSFPPLADVFLGAKKMGNTEQMFAREFPPGEYRFTFSIPDYRSAEVRVMVVAGETTAAHFRFPPFRSFTIIARPFGRVFIDSREYGDTPQTVKLAYGEHLVRIAKGGYMNQERTIRVDAGTKNSIFFELSKEEKK
ncbi:MAG: serine/threonine protein kinase [Candidatus Aminicenantes bacterium]|nr:serine/threonine protein kinase [Candidatus Aminicenantes bacterium]